MTDASIHDAFVYDEFGYLRDNAEEAGIPWNGLPHVTRTDLAVGDGRVVSTLRWGEEDPEIVLLHGGGQNAHTFDTVALALGAPLIAVDLPGHGHSSWREDWRYGPQVLAPDVATVIENLAPRAALVAGMSLGGLTAAAVAEIRPSLVRQLALIDITPGVNRENRNHVRAIYEGPPSYESLDQMVEFVVNAGGSGTASQSLRRGVTHNARQREDRRWVWRHHRGRQDVSRPPEADFLPLWDVLASLSPQIRLICGSQSPIIGEEERAEFKKLVPSSHVIVVPDARHSVQTDQPIELARILRLFANDSSSSS